VRIVRAFLQAVAVLVLMGPIRADSWGPYDERRDVSPGGRHYVVARFPKDGPLRLELCRRREGAAPLEPARRDDDHPAPVVRDPEDALVAAFDPEDAPLEMRVLDAEPAAVLFEKYGNVGFGTSLALLDGTGKLRWSLQLTDLFPPQRVREFGRTVSSIWWWQGWWIDEDRGKVVLVAEGGLIREVDLGTGKVEAAGAEVLLTRVGKGPVDDQRTALEIAASLKPPGLAEKARAIALDEKADPSLRLGAAVAHHAVTGKPLVPDLFRKYAAAGAPAELRPYAVGNLGAMLGEEALPLLRDAMRGPATDVWHPAQEAFASLGEKAVPTLVEMLLDPQGTPDQRGGAAHALGEIRSPKALDALLEATRKADEYTANAAVNAAIETGGANLAERLAAILAQGCTQDSRIAMFFEENPADLAVDPLLKALARAQSGTFDRRAIAEALRACTGLDCGEDPEAWRKRLGR
jgi:hypothetical protein